MLSVSQFRFAIRSLRKSASFAATAVVTLALGVGANASVFAVASVLLLRPMPWAEPDRLVRLWSSVPERGLSSFSISGPDYLDWVRRSQAFEGLAAYDRQRLAVLAGDGRTPEEVLVARTTAELFPLIGAAPALGRTFAADEIQQGGGAVAVITDGFWRGALGADPRVLGRAIELDGRRVTIVGVMAPEFIVPGNPAAVWTPLALSEADDRGNRYLRVVGRLNPGWDVAAASAEMRGVTAALATQHPSTNTGWGITIQSLNELVVSPGYRRAVQVLLAVVLLVLVVACANVSNLALSRASARRHETAVRLALGASRGRVMREWLTESAVLGVGAGVAGVVLGSWGLDLLRVTSPSGIPRLDEIRMDGGVVALTLVLSVVASVAAGIGPALHALSATLSSALREGRSHAGTRGTRRVRNATLVMQVAFAMLLLTGAGLLLQSFRRLLAVDTGFDARGLVIAPVVLPEAGYGEGGLARVFYEQLMERARGLPGVSAASMVSSAPFAGPDAAYAFVTEALAVTAGQNAPDADSRVVAPGYFTTMNIGLVSGRDFTEADGTGVAPVIISETLARQYLADRDPIGQQLRLGDIANGPWRTVIGVVRDARYQSLETPALRPMIYLPYRTRASMMLVLRSSGNTETLSQALRAEVQRLDPGLPLGTVSKLEDLLDFAYAQRRLQLMLFGVFATLAAVLAVVGLYGAVTYMVMQRRRELGVRYALGARAHELRRLVVARGLGLALLGVAIGLAACFALTRTLQSILFETQTIEPVVFAGVALLLLGLAGLASWAPARRVTRLDPVSALRDAN
jgi:putative ABC transport system permease protein